jgi:hypothetical protein
MTAHSDAELQHDAWMRADYWQHRAEKDAVYLAAARARLEWAEKDAARYRWLRACSVERGSVLADDFWAMLGDKLDDDFDAAIDAALAQGRKE